jgi:hypothetical protein
MLDRLASQSWHLRGAPVASVEALQTLAALLHDGAGDLGEASQSRDSGAASGSQEAIPGDAHATPTDTAATDLFAHPSDADPVPTTLPDGARVTLTKLMVRLILDHAVGAQPDGGAA